MLVLADVLLAMTFAINKVYQKKAGVTLKAGFFFNALGGLFTIFIFFIINGFKVHFSFYSLIMAVFQTSFVTTYSLISFRILKTGTLALYTLFLMSGGMIVPYVWGLLFLNEEFSLIRTAGLIIIVVAVVLSNFDGKKTDRTQFLMCSTVFVLNGFVSVVSKTHQIENKFTTVNSAEFVFWGGVCKLIIAGIIYLIVKNRENTEIQSSRGIVVIPLIALSALIGGVAYLLQLYGAIDLPATVLYPFVTGGSIIFSTLAGAILFKDKLNTKLVVSVLLCFIGTVMFL